MTLDLWFLRHHFFQERNHGNHPPHCIGNEVLEDALNASASVFGGIWRGPEQGRKTLTARFAIPKHGVNGGA